VVTRVTRLRIGNREFPATRLSVAPRYSDPGPEALARIREERRTITSVLSKATADWLPRGGFSWPRDTRITSPFGQRRVFNQELRSRHTGVDLAGRTGAPVGAAARGRVALTGNFYFAGNAVYLDHGLGVYTAYFHLSRIDVEEGQLLERGEVLGGVGATGRVTGPHLHWSLYVNGQSLDASSLLHLGAPAPETPADAR
jgi:murein DD-endopeptidase MepM/ murein hydrolase activator NlpD